MNPARALGRLARILAALAAAALAVTITTAAALATPRPTPPGWNKHPPVPASPQPTLRYPPGWNKHPPLPAHLHALATGGMPGWQIALIAAAVLASALAALLLARARAARRRTAASPAWPATSCLTGHQPAAPTTPGRRAQARHRRPQGPTAGPLPERRPPVVNANDAAPTGLTTAHTGSPVAGPAPSAPAHPGFDLVLEAAAGSAPGSRGARHTPTISPTDPTTARQARPAQAHRQALDTDSGWKLSGPGPHYHCTQTFPVTIPGRAGGPLAGHVPQCAASPVSHGAQIVSITRSHPFVLA
jgi:hypothetical protein